MILTGLLSLALLAADGGSMASDGATDLQLKVGETASVEVSALQGLMCDDMEIIRPTLEGGQASNRLVVKGLKPGSTTCKVGTTGTGFFRIVRITVTKN
jgi:hypothetical protein